MVNIDKANKEVKELFNYLSPIATDIVKNRTKLLDNTIKKLSVDIETLSNEQIRNYMAILSVEAYNLSLDKEQSALKDSCATALYKEGVATSFSGSVGTVESRKNQSTIDNLDKQAVSILYSTVYELFKTKVDEAHRVVNVLSNILISRSAEAKLQYNPRSEEIIYLNSVQENKQEV